jgi:hypothetical protein
MLLKRGPHTVGDADDLVAHSKNSPKQNLTRSNSITAKFRSIEGFKSTGSAMKDTFICVLERDGITMWALAEHLCGKTKSPVEAPYERKSFVTVC